MGSNEKNAAVCCQFDDIFGKQSSPECTNTADSYKIMIMITLKYIYYIPVYPKALCFLNPLIYFI